MTDTWCPLPWMHQFITTKGVKTCCESLYEEPCTPNDFADSAVVKDIKHSILQGKEHAHCANCFKLESRGFTSIRQESIRNWPNYSPTNLPKNIEYLELRYNNLCNFSCKMCSPDFSSSIGRLVEQNPDLQTFYYNDTKKQNSYDLIFNDIEKNLSTVKRINFAGGEPLLNKDNIKILERLVELGNTDCEICIITNASAINPYWIDKIKQFKRTHWTISLDGINKTAEYIRVGTEWAVVEKNIDTILSLGNSVAFNTTLSAYSVLDLYNTVKFFVEKKQHINTRLELWFGLCQWPTYLRPSLLKDQYAQKAKQELENSIKLLSTIASNPSRSINELQNVLDNIQTLDDKESYQKFVEFTNKMDTVHNMSFEAVFNIRSPHV